MPAPRRPFVRCARQQRHYRPGASHAHRSRKRSWVCSFHSTSPSSHSSNRSSAIGMFWSYHCLHLPALSPATRRNGSSFRVEGEQHPDLAASRRAGTQFFHVVMARALDSVGGRSSEAGSLGFQPGDRSRNQVVGSVIESEDPRLHVFPEPHVPRHATYDRRKPILAQVDIGDRSIGGPGRQNGSRPRAPQRRSAVQSEGLEACEGGIDRVRLRRARAVDAVPPHEVGGD